MSQTVDLACRLRNGSLAAKRPRVVIVYSDGNQLVNTLSSEPTQYAFHNSKLAVIYGLSVVYCSIYDALCGVVQYKTLIVRPIPCSLYVYGSLCRQRNFVKAQINAQLPACL